MRAAQLFLGGVLAGDIAQHAGAGDEHFALAVHHDYEVRQCRGIRVAARARAHDGRNLRHDAGGLRIPAQGAGDGIEGIRTLLDPRTGAGVQANQWAPHRDGHLHDRAHLVAVHLAEGAAEDLLILGEHAHLAAVDGAPACDKTVAGDAFFSHAERGGSMGRLGPDFRKGVVVEEVVESFARVHVKQCNTTCRPLR